MPRDDAFDPLTLLPEWWKKEKPLTHMLPYVSLVDDVTVRTRGNELFQCIRLEGVNSSTMDDDYLDRTRALFASIISQIGPEFSFYVHKVSKTIDPDLAPIAGDDFAAAVNRRWTDGLRRSDLRDKTLTLTVIHRPSLGSKVPFSGKKSMKALRDQIERRMRRLGEVVGFLRSTFASMNPRLLSAEKGELLGFLGGLNTGQELPLYRRSKYGYVSDDVSNTRVTFRGRVFEISDGAVGRRFGTSFAIKNYPAKTSCTMFDELNLPVDMVVTHSFTPINSNLMASRIKREQRLRRASDDGARSLAAELEDALDDLESKRLSFGEHHMSVTVFADTLERLEGIAGEVRNTAATEGVNLVSEAFAARTHYFAQHPGNGAKRSRKAAVTNHNFADFAAFHRSPLGKRGHRGALGNRDHDVPDAGHVGLLVQLPRAGLAHEGADQRPYADPRPSRVGQVHDLGLPDDAGPPGGRARLRLRLPAGAGNGRPGERRSLRSHRGGVGHRPEPAPDRDGRTRPSPGSPTGWRR